MTDLETTLSASMVELDRLRRRVERERAARLEAEAIAERGLRDLYDINQDLDRKVQERVAESERLAQRAALAERVKGEILNSVSHELRTPLMAVVGALDLLASGGGDHEKCLDAAVAGADRLRELVDELFAIVDIDSDAEANLEAVELGSFIEAQADAWRLRAMGGGALLVTSVDSHSSRAWLDVDRTKAALDRLIDNALKHGGPGTITLAASLTDQLQLEVTDEGPGIEPHRLSSLLEPFEMGDRSSTRSSSGMGLGLAVSKALIELQGGTLRIESELGVGTSVFATFPQVRDLDQET